MIVVNGKETELAGVATLAELISQRGLNPATVVIEHNRTIVPREAWHATALNAGDSVEIVTFVGGG